MSLPNNAPGPIVLFGSGETSPSGRKIFSYILNRLPFSPDVVLLETPAGFEPNSPQVVGKVADFLTRHLQNRKPRPQVVAARKRATAFSPDDPEIAGPILSADLIFLGPGSPTYAVRQLRGSLTWQYLVARHRLGAGLALASAAVIAVGSHALPVYEIYKVGQDLHWTPGLDLFAPFGLSLVFIPHWNNNDGGAELDTSRCYMGRERFDTLLEMLSPGQVVVGIDERTGLALDLEKGICEVVGAGRVVIIRDDRRRVMKGLFSIEELGDFRMPDPRDGIPPDVWQAALGAKRTPPGVAAEPPGDILSLVEQRQTARATKNWSAADELRLKIEDAGWQVQDTPEGPLVSKL
ncbi:MAG: cysteinyl-tRNA synthetase [Anaerolineales bacterium]|nr:cysteinyl-tRNA synthetase [Chloroflexota bacterium]MBL7162565.1 cysteinyl-tRNA synthetase [Anaerolineales bacterium]